MQPDDTFEDVEIPDWEPPVRKLCKHYEQENICKRNDDRRIISLDWCSKCNHYTPGEITAPKPEHKETQLMPRGRVGKVDWNQPAANIFKDGGGVTLREYLKRKVEDNPGCATELAVNHLGVTPGAMLQAIKRVPAASNTTLPTGPLVERNSKKVECVKPADNIGAKDTPINPRWPNGVDWNIQAPRVVGTQHRIKPIGVTLINWCSDCLDEDCYSLEELAEAISCTPAELQAALDKYHAEAEDELEEEEPEADRSNNVTCYDPAEARETECVKQENNIPADYTPAPGKWVEDNQHPDYLRFEIDPPAPSIQPLETNEQWHNTMTSAFAETAPDALSAFLRVTGQEELFRGFMLGYEARGEEAA